MAPTLLPYLFVFSTVLAVALGCTCSATPGTGVCADCSKIGGHGISFTAGSEYISFGTSNTTIFNNVDCYYGSCRYNGMGLNFEIFQGVAASASDTYTQASGVASLVDCCSACKADPTCNYFHYYPKALSYPNNLNVGINNPPNTPSNVGPAPVCYLIHNVSLTKQTDGDYNNLPYSDVHSVETVSTVNGVVEYKYYLPSWVGCQCNSGGQNDPHLRGGHGTKYDFNGRMQKAYCMLTSQDFAITSLLDGYKVDRTEHSPSGTVTWMKQMGFLWKEAGVKHSLRMVARNSPQVERGSGYLAALEVDGLPITLPALGDAVELPGDVVISFERTGKSGSFETEEYRLTLKGNTVIDISMRVAQTVLRTKEDAYAHFSFQITNMNPAEDIHGVLGQTYRSTPEQIMRAVKYSQLDVLLHRNFHADAEEGVGFLDGTPDDYITSSVTAADCKFSTF